MVCWKTGTVGTTFHVNRSRYAWYDPPCSEYRMPPLSERSRPPTLRGAASQRNPPAKPVWPYMPEASARLELTKAMPRAADESFTTVARRRMTPPPGLAYVVPDN